MHGASSVVGGPVHLRTHAFPSPPSCRTPRGSSRTPLSGRGTSFSGKAGGCQSPTRVACAPMCSGPAVIQKASGTVGRQGQRSSTPAATDPLGDSGSAMCLGSPLPHACLGYPPPPGVIEGYVVVCVHWEAKTWGTADSLRARKGKRTRTRNQPMVWWWLCKTYAWGNAELRFPFPCAPCASSGIPAAGGRQGPAVQALGLPVCVRWLAQAPARVPAGGMGGCVRVPGTHGGH
jgi:hypothetical protein